jgi:hypothetical protein
MLNFDASVYQLIFFGNKFSPCGSVVHAGDNLTGEGSGDDETIAVDLSRVPPNVAALFFTVNVFTKGKSFTPPLSCPAAVMPIVCAVDTAISALQPSLQLRQWVVQPETAPPSETLVQPCISHVLVTAYHCAAFAAVLGQCRGEVTFMDLRSALATGGIVTLGKSVLAAMAIAATTAEEDYVANVVTMARASYYVGLVHQTYNSTLIAEVMKYPVGTCALHVINIPMHSLAAIVDATNSFDDGSGNRPVSDLCISRVLAPRSAVVNPSLCTLLNEW